jgi:hypothetical protein
VDNGIRERLQRIEVVLNELRKHNYTDANAPVVRPLQQVHAQLIVLRDTRLPQSVLLARRKMDTFRRLQALHDWIVAGEHEQHKIDTILLSQVWNHFLSVHYTLTGTGRQCT